MQVKNTLAKAAALGLAATVAALAPQGSASARPAPDRSATCFVPDQTGTAAAARGGHGPDTRDISAAEQARIEARTARILHRPAAARRAQEVAASGATVPVYVHVMTGSNGEGDVTDQQISDQIAELNEDFSGGESADAADTGFTFTLAGTDRYANNVWHRDRASAQYRKATRQGGADALNIWVVDFKYLGIATFPWDYQKKPGIDGIRVNYRSLPGGPTAHYSLGKTASHEAGHWFGLYHTFQGGCTEPNDEVADTPAQSGPTEGCPEGRDSCSLPGLDPIHNYMDYSFDECYTQFTPDQATRAQAMFAAYRAG